MYTAGVRTRLFNFTVGYLLHHPHTPGLVSQPRKHSLVTESTGGLIDLAASNGVHSKLDFKKGICL